MMEQELKSFEILEDKSFYQHFNEFRLRLLYCVVFYCFSFAIVFYYSDKAIDYIINRINEASLRNSIQNISFCVINITDLFFCYIKVSAYMGFIVSLPFILFQIWSFIRPALYAKEVNFTREVIIGGFILFILGNLFLFHWGLPAISCFLISTFYRSNIEFNISIKSYVDFGIILGIILGIVFQTPLIIVIISVTKICSIKKIVKIRKYVIVMAFIIGGIITPPDVVSQIIVATLIIIFVELGIIISKFLNKNS